MLKCAIKAINIIIIIVIVIIIIVIIIIIIIIIHSVKHSLRQTQQFTLLRVGTTGCLQNWMFKSLIWDIHKSSNTLLR